MSYSRILILFCFSSIFASFTLTGYPLFPSRALADHDASDIAKLVKQLGSDSFQERESAMAALRRIGRPALPTLRAAQSSSDGEIRRRARTLVRELDVGIQPLLDRRATIDYYGGQKPSPLSVESVSMVGSAFGDDDVKNVREFTKMRTLDLCCSRITNAGLARIEHLSNLQQLFLNRTDVSDLASIRKLTKLTHLYLDDTRITDEKLAPIKNLADLYSLDLSFTKVSDSGLVHLAQLKNLHQLVLANTKKPRQNNLSNFGD
jgi:hypothetical protein